MDRVAWRWLFFLLTGLGLTGCGSGSSAPNNPGNQNPVLSLQAISPNSSDQSGPGFTISVVGSNFLPSSVIKWNGTNLQTSFVSDALLTAQVPARDLVASGPDAVRVTNPSPGGGTSSVLNFAVPCVIDPPTPA